MGAESGKEKKAVLLHLETSLNKGIVKKMWGWTRWESRTLIYVNRYFKSVLIYIPFDGVKLVSILNLSWFVFFFSSLWRQLSNILKFLSKWKGYLTMICVHFALFVYWRTGLRLFISMYSSWMFLKMNKDLRDVSGLSKYLQHNDNTLSVSFSTKEWMLYVTRCQGICKIV